MKEYIDKDVLYDLIRVTASQPEHFISKIYKVPTTTEAEIRAKAIDDFVENISLEMSESLIWGMIADCFKYKNMSDTSDKIVDYIIETSKKIAEQLKALSAN